MNIYLVSQSENATYDTYDSFICVAASEEDAQRMTPFSCPENIKWSEDGRLFERFSEGLPWRPSNRWARYLSAIEVTLVGRALPEAKAEILLASFNAG